MRIAGLSFTPSLWPSLGAIVLLCLFVSLGVWQVNRAAEKRAMLVDFDRRASAEPVDLGSPVEDPERWRHRRVAATGQFDSQQQFLLDNRVNRGRAGYNVLTPLRLSTASQAVLVDRGWVPQGATRAHLPQVNVSEDRDSATGYVYIPQAGYRVGDIDETDRGWPRVIQYIDFEMLSERLGYPLMELVIRMDPAETNGYLREWQLAPFSPARHTGYAVQWFALAFAVCVVYLVLNVKRADG
ncbi:MAG: SURF1 family protein [Gammaproteobacteria bacterium]